jgi:hypothetical protein
MPHSARAMHHVRGRIRLKIPASRGNASLLEEIKRAIAPLEGVKRIDSNPVTGTLVIHYDPEIHPEFHETLSDHGERAGSYVLAPAEMSEVDELAKQISEEADFLSQHSETARTIVEGFKSLDRSIKLGTGNAVDLKVLLPLGLAVYSFIEIGLEASTPLWVTLGIFSFNSFLSLHAPDPKANTTTALVIGSKKNPHRDRQASEEPAAASQGETTPGRKPTKE